jgi:hypothetical protein
MTHQQQSYSIIIVLDFDDTLVKHTGGTPMIRLSEIWEDEKQVRRGHRRSIAKIIHDDIIRPNDLKNLVDCFIYLVQECNAVLYLNTRGHSTDIPRFFNSRFVRINDIQLNQYIQLKTGNRFMSLFPQGEETSKSLCKGIYGASLSPDNEFFILPVLYSKLKKVLQEKQGQLQQAYMDRVEKMLKREIDVYYAYIASKQDQAKIDAQWTPEELYYYKEKVVWAFQKVLYLLQISLRHPSIPVYFFDDDKINIDIARAYFQGFERFHAVHLLKDPRPPIPFLRAINEILIRRKQSGGGGGEQKQEQKQGKTKKPRV